MRYFGILVLKTKYGAGWGLRLLRDGWHTTTMAVTSEWTTATILNRKLLPLVIRVPRFSGLSS